MVVQVERPWEFMAKGLDFGLDLWKLHTMPGNVRGELVISVMVAGWFCKTIRLNWESGGCETGAFNLKNGFQPATILRRRIFTRMNCEIGRFHPV